MRLHELNDAYSKRFGRPFIIARYRVPDRETLFAKDQFYRLNEGNDTIEIDYGTKSATMQFGLGSVWQQATNSMATFEALLPCASARLRRNVVAT